MKPWWQSKTIWFNVAAGAVDAFAMAAGAMPGVPGAVLASVNVANILLRNVTTAAVGGAR